MNTSTCIFMYITCMEFHSVSVQMSMQIVHCLKEITMLCITAAVTKAVTGMSEQVNATVAQVSFSRKGTISIAHYYHGPGWCIYKKLYVFQAVSLPPHSFVHFREQKQVSETLCLKW